MKYSDTIANIAKALSEVQAEIRNPIKTETNGGVQGSPKYATLEDTLADYVRPVLSKHGMSFVQSLSTNDKGQVGVQTILLHESGEYIEGDYIYCDVVIPTSKAGNKILTEGQATGVCITYLRRYSLNAAIGINGDKDTDGAYGETEPLSYESALDMEITFGKHAGQTLKELYKTDRSYIDWLANNEKTDKTLKEAIKIINARITAYNSTKEVMKEEGEWNVQA